MTAGCHRYFGYRSYKLGRTAQFVMAFLAQTSAQKGVLWWSAHHRSPHKKTEGSEYPHSPVQPGFWWELDVTYRAIKVLEWIGIARDLRELPAAEVSRP